MKALDDAGYPSEQADEDADVMIVTTALKTHRQTPNCPTVIVGEDIGLLVILTQLSQHMDQIYFSKPARPKIPGRYYSKSSFRHPDLLSIVCFLHAFCGCDTTSAFYGKGKNSIVKLFKGNKNIQDLAQCFNDPFDEKKVTENGIKIICKLYDEKDETFNLNDLRYKLYIRKTASKSFKLENLPPTNSVAEQHCLRVYLQVQLWLGENTELQASSLGWQLSEDGMRPMFSKSDSLIPQDLIKRISCSCKGGCRTAICSCVKHGVPCTELCSKCHGATCENVREESIAIPIDDPNSSFVEDSVDIPSESGIIPSGIVDDDDDCIENDDNWDAYEHMLHDSN
ncbi:hypothetical protein QAD02_024028 [Eretmocerus hayati]|uniref:Uncharacterized protein n=1 Tax=Eretmocerus hayati TaxID=131215 RepID=A0ACC2PYN6_9HYME|nr:hypothetical protein QAD02_024028 [Eretmocerus hayati]